MIPRSKNDWMNINGRTFAIPVAILFSAAVISAAAYTLPALPAMPVVVTAAANSMPRSDPASFAETNMDFAIETNGPFQPAWSSIASNNTHADNGASAWLRQAKVGLWVHYGPQANLQSGDWPFDHARRP
jgi:alpha-L-fucosidase